MEGWDATVGPFLDEDGARVLTGLSAKELGDCIASHDVLSVITSDEVVLMPTFQFGDHGELLPALRSVDRKSTRLNSSHWE